MPYDSKRYQLKSIYIPRDLCGIAEEKTKKEYMNFSAYVRRLIYEDLKKDDKVFIE